MPMLGRMLSDKVPICIGADTASNSLAARCSNCSRLTGPAGRQAAELVTAQAADHVTRTHGAAQPDADDAQHLVAGGMAVLVVHELEVVEIQEHQRQRRRRWQPLLQGLVQTLNEVAPVRQLGQSVMQARRRACRSPAWVRASSACACASVSRSS